ncbi:hypothetical protein DVH05_020254 [Phytophthora capsici]|nr:hypothetical protein DVH05_020254 [Phytophthora capsici]
MLWSPCRGKAPVYRSIGPPRPYNLDPFLILDEFNVGLSGSFQDHIMFVPPAAKTTCAKSPSRQQGRAKEKNPTVDAPG